MAGDAAALGLFTWLWAQVMVLQVVKLALPLASANASLGFATLRWPVLLAWACLAGVLLPRRTWVTVQLMVSSILVLWFTGSQSNHVFMDMAVCLAVLTSYSPDRERWQAQAAYAIQAFLVVLYSVTALHKLNTGWGDPRYSCSTLMLGGILALSPLRWAQPLVPVALAPQLAVLTELALPLLILSGRCPRTATVLGCSFHVAICQMVSPMSVYPFSVLMAPPYVFLIPGRASAMFSCLRPWGPYLIACYAVACRLWTPLVAGDLPPGEVPFEYPAYGLWAPGVVWCNFALPALAMAALWPWGSAEEARPVPTKCGRLLAVFVLTFGLTPYLGLRNYPALAMFSNLRTEGGRGNHLFLRDDFDLLGWQRDYVTVHATDIPVLRLAQVDLAPLFTSATKKALAVTKVDSEFWIVPPASAWPYAETREFRPYSMPFLELRRRLAPLKASGSANGTVRYTRTMARARLAMPWLWRGLGIENVGEDHVRANITYDLAEGGDAELELPLPKWQALVARFRAFDVDYSPCRH